MGWLGSSRRIARRLVPLVSLGIAACATSAEPVAELDDGGPGGTTAGGASAGSPPLAGRLGVAGAPVAGSSSGGTSAMAGRGAGGSTSSSSGGASAGRTSGGGSSSGRGGGASAGSASGGSAGKASGGSAGKASGGSAGKSVGGSAGESGALGEAGVGLTGGTGGGSTSGCNAQSASAKATHSKTIDVKSDACVALIVDPTWSAVNVTIEGQPGTAGYPIPFSYVICNGKGGTGELTANYLKEELFKGMNPGCDIYVQFEGTGTALKLTYYD